MAYTNRNRIIRVIARPQLGLFNHAQAMASGYTRDALRRAIARGEFRDVPSSRLPGERRSCLLEQTAMGAHLWAGEPSALSFESAAAARGYLPTTEPIHISTTKTSLTPPPGIIVHRIDGCLLDQIEYHGHLPLTSEPRTALDLAGIGNHRTDWVLDAGIRNGTPILAYAMMLDDIRMRGKRGVRRLGQKLESRDPTLAPTDSDVEDLALRLIRRAGLPLPRTQWPETISTGPIRLDLAWPDRLYNMELDSAGWHLNLASMESDRLRDDELSLKGWFTSRYTATRLKFQPDSFITTIEYHLRTRPKVA